MAQVPTWCTGHAPCSSNICVASHGMRYTFSCSIFTTGPGAEHYQVACLISERTAELIRRLKAISAIEKEAAGFEVPNTFTLGYYLCFVSEDIPELPVSQLNELTHKKTEQDFMDAFMAKAQKAVEYSNAKTDEARAEASALLKEKANLFTRDFDQKSARAVVRELKEKVLRCQLSPISLQSTSPSGQYRNDP